MGYYDSLLCPDRREDDHPGPDPGQQYAGGGVRGCCHPASGMGNSLCSTVMYCTLYCTLPQDTSVESLTAGQYGLKYGTLDQIGQVGGLVPR